MQRTRPERERVSETDSDSDSYRANAHAVGEQHAAHPTHSARPLLASAVPPVGAPPPSLGSSPSVLWWCLLSQEEVEGGAGTTRRGGREPQLKQAAMPLSGARHTAKSQCKTRPNREHTVLELISETASNLRTLIFGEFPNFYCENAPRVTQ